jgi:hypothetical protein
MPDGGVSISAVTVLPIEEELSQLQNEASPITVERQNYSANDRPVKSLSNIL